MDNLIKRRTAIRSLLIIAGGAMVLPACYRQSGKASIQLSNLNLTEADEELLEMLAESLIPETDTPGSKSLKLHLFVLKMVDDCYKPEDHDKFTKGLQAFPAYAKSVLGKDFATANTDERTTLLLNIQEIKKTEITENAGNTAELELAGNIKRFYDISKSKVIQGYMNSKYVMTNLVKYELVPGRYNGYFPA